MTLLLLLISACGATAVEIVPTDLPTATPTFTDAPTNTPAHDVTPTITPSPIPQTPTGGPSPTSLFGPAPTSANASTQDVVSLNPNAPKIEFFTSDSAAVAPGSVVTLYWSTRGARDAVIYQLVNGVRNRLWNVGPEGSLPIQTNHNDRGAVNFVLSVGEGTAYVEQTLAIPLACPNTWFFQPPPEACPTSQPQNTQLTEEPFERGRMIYDANSDQVYALFNDAAAPAWLVLPNKYDPATDPNGDPNFSPPPGEYQPLNELGFVWRGNDTVRNRLGLATSPEAKFNGYSQSAPVSVSANGSASTSLTLYLSSSDGTVLQLEPQGASWEIITPPPTK